MRDGSRVATAKVTRNHGETVKVCEGASFPCPEGHNHYNLSAEGIASSRMRQTHHAVVSSVVELVFNMVEWLRNAV